MSLWVWSVQVSEEGQVDPPAAPDGGRGHRLPRARARPRRRQVPRPRHHRG